MKTLQSLFFLLVVILTSISSSTYSQDQSMNFDLVILNGRVMDPETGFDQVANVGINNGFITKITNENIKGTRTIDATGHVVAPGFIDFHVHGQDPYGFRLLARDGVTTPLELEMGAYPIDEFYKLWEGKALLNYGAAVSHAWARLQVLDNLDAGGNVIYQGAVEEAFKDGQNWKTKIYDPKDVPLVVNAVENGLDQGGLGVAFPLGYYTIVGSPEVMAVGQMAKKHNTFITSHVRYLAQIPPSGYLGIEEVLTVSEQNDLPLYLFHVPSNCLGLTDVCFDMIDEARARAQ